MRWVARTALIATAGLILTAAPSPAQEKEKPAKGDRNTIIQAEFQSREDLKSAWDIAHVLRPQWFRASRRATSTDRVRNDDAAAWNPIVYIDNMRQNSIEVLRTIRSAEVVEIKYMEPQKAMALYDDSHMAGAIFVTTNRLQR